MNLRKYNIEFTLQPIGLDNIGFTCYFNSLIQALLSCTSFVEAIIDLGPSSKDPMILVLYHLISSIKLLEQSNDEQKNQIRQDLLKLGPVCWKIFMKKLREKMPDIGKYFIGQQCAAEAFSLLLEIFDNYRSIQTLFMYRRINKIYCPDCKQTFSTISEIGNIFEIDIHLDEKFDLNSILLKQIESIDENCICSKCNIKSNKIKSSNLVMIPEILFVMCKKYKYENNRGKKIESLVNFPHEIKFPGKDEQLVYRAVSQIQHSGSLNSGHYWTNCQRSDGWYCLNDSHISKNKYEPDIYTYIVVYHVI